MSDRAIILPADCTIPEAYLIGKKESIQEFLADLDDFSWRWDIEDAGVQDWIKMRNKWENKLKGDKIE